MTLGRFSFSSILLSCSSRAPSRRSPAVLHPPAALRHKQRLPQCRGRGRGHLHEHRLPQELPGMPTPPLPQVHPCPALPAELPGTPLVHVDWVLLCLSWCGVPVGAGAVPCEDQQHGDGPKAVKVGVLYYRLCTDLKDFELHDVLVVYLWCACVRRSRAQRGSTTQPRAPRP